MAMTPPGTLNLDMYAGATFDYTLTWAEDSTPVNLTGYSARMQARRSYTESAYVFELTSSSGITLGGSAGTIALLYSATNTATVGTTLANTKTQLVYDLELVSGTGVVTRLVQGVITVWPEVTR